MPPPPPASKYNSDGVPILDEINDENVSQAIETSLPYFEAEKGLLETRENMMTEKSASQEKTNVLDHIQKEKAIVEGRIIELKKKEKVKDIIALIAEEKKDRKVRKTKEDELLELLDKVTAGNPFVTEELGEKKEGEQMENENNLSRTIRNDLQQAKEEAKKIVSSKQATLSEQQGSVSSEPQSDILAGTEEMFSTSSSTKSSGDFPFYIPESTATADTQTPQPSGVTAENVKMVCTNLLNKIADLEEQIAKLQKDNTGTPTEIKVSTNSQNDNTGTPRGGRKSRNNKKKKKSKAKKNKTRRRRRSKA